MNCWSSGIATRSLKLLSRRRFVRVDSCGTIRHSTADGGSKGVPRKRLFTCSAYSMPYERPSEQMISMRKLLYHAIQAAERGGSEVRAVQETGNLEVRSKSFCYNPVTLGDMRSHIAMKGTLRQAFPYVSIVSEEDNHCLDSVAVDLEEDPEDPPSTFLRSVPQDQMVSAQDITIWIDPLDGTQEYTEGHYEYVTTMVGIAVGGVPVAGVIHQPFPERSASSISTYWAWKNHAVCPLLQSSNSSIPDPSEPSGTAWKLAVSRNPLRAGAARRFSKAAFGADNCELVPIGGAGYKFIQLFRNKVNGYLHLTKNIKKWDTCAGHGITNALGGQLTSLNGEEIDYSEPESKSQMAVGSGFIGAVHNHNALLSGCRRVPT